GGKAFADGLDDGNTPGYRRFERHVHALLLGSSKHFIAMLGDQGLVGGDHVLAVFDGLHHQIAGGGGAAHQFHHDVHFRIVYHGENIAGHFHTGSIHGRIVAAGTNMGNQDLAPGAAGNVVPVTVQHIECTAAHGTQPHDANIHRFQATHLIVI